MPDTSAKAVLHSDGERSPRDCQGSVHTASSVPLRQRSLTPKISFRIWRVVIASSTLTSISPGPSSSISTSADPPPSDGVPLATWDCVPRPRLSIDKARAESRGACREIPTSSDGSLVTGRGPTSVSGHGTSLLVLLGPRWRRYYSHITGRKFLGRFQSTCESPSESNWLCSCCSRL